MSLRQTYRFQPRPGPPGVVWMLLTLALVGVMISGKQKIKNTVRPIASAELSVVVSECVPDQPTVNVYDPQKNEIQELPLEEYIIRVVAAEMPAAYEPEALKAQAVAARTLTMQRIRGNGCSAREGADVCADHGHCQAYCAPETMTEKWGESAEKYRQKISEAVYATQGEVLYYEGALIDVFYHAQSAGATEELAHVFSGSRPYLVSVSSDEAVKPVTEKISASQVAERINKAYPEAKLEAEKLGEQIAVEKNYESGRASQVKMGNVVLTGVQVRRALGLRSARFSVNMEQDTVIFTTLGYGHGVGMSQAGAQAMARDGADYQAILAHYYPGTTLGKAS